MTIVCWLLGHAWDWEHAVVTRTVRRWVRPMPYDEPAEKEETCARCGARRRWAIYHVTCGTWVLPA